jgi:xanthine phosphoribosyltransferase
MDREFYSYQKFVKDIETLTPTLSRKNFDGIVAISRGGLTLAHFLSEKLDIRRVFSIGAISYEKEKQLENLSIFGVPDLREFQKVLIVDDISDSGRTLNGVSLNLQSSFPEVEFQTLSIFYKTSSAHKPDYYLHQTENWIDFFWSGEIDGI